MRRSSADRRGWSMRPRFRIGRRGFSLLMVVALAGGMFVSTTPPNVSADALTDAYATQKALQTELAQEKAQIAALSASQNALSLRIDSTKATLNQLNANLDATRAQVVQMTVQVAQAQASVDSLVTMVSKLDDQLAAVEADEQAKQAQLDARKAILADRIRTAYDTDRTSLLEAFLSSSDFTDVLVEAGYHLDFAQQDKVLAQEIVQDQQVLAVVHQTVVETRQQTDQLAAVAAQQKTQLDKQLADLAAARAQLAKLEAQTAALLAAQKAAYARLSANKAQLKSKLAAEQQALAKEAALIDKLVKELYAAGIPSVYSGTLRWPMAGTITQEFGCTGVIWEPPLGDCAHFHTGIDIANSYGTPIHAAGPGVVVYTGCDWDPYGACMVVIAHSTQLQTWYGHVTSSIPVHKGQVVSAGQLIAYEGCTGLCTGPHLHWAVRLNGTWVNPRLFV